MSKKIDRATHGPSWTEVILGAVLSAVLGVVLGGVLLVLRPVVVAKDAPKEEEKVRGAVYYIEGSRDTAKAKQALPKRKAFAGGQSVTVTEEELNVLANPGTAPAAPGKAPEKGKAAPKGKEAEKPAEPASGMFTLGGPNFRLRRGEMQIAVPVTVNTLDLGLKVMVQARGGITKSGDGFVFDPAELYVGSCPVQRLPIVGSYVRSQFLSSAAIPDDIKASWAKVAAVAIEGNQLKLTMP
jgi:hypothetical protein